MLKVIAIEVGERTDAFASLGNGRKAMHLVMYSDRVNSHHYSVRPQDNVRTVLNQICQFGILRDRRLGWRPGRLDHFSKMSPNLCEVRFKHCMRFGT